MKSCLYECGVYHKRFSPKAREFRYRIFIFAIDLDELDELCAKIPLFSRNRFNLYSFRDSDHLNFGTASLKESVITYLAKNGVTFPESGRILLVTLPRVLGYIFNPVSFYFCTDKEGQPICAVVEVGNTFREIKPYFVGERNEAGRFHRRVMKHFYVSPFIGLNVEFDFRLAVPGERLNIHINDFDGSELVLCSYLCGVRKPLTTASLASFTIKYPLITLKVITLIHWQALKLWLSRVPHRAKAAEPEAQRGVLNPHPSIAGKSA